MKFEGKNTLCNGNIPRGRREKGELNKRTRLMKIIGQENYEQVCKKQVDIALYSENPDQAATAQRFIMSLSEPKPSPIPHETYVEHIPLLPMRTIENIRHNSDLVLGDVCNGNMPLEVGERLFNLIEQARKNWEATEMKRMLDETNQRITKMEKERGIGY